MLSPKLEILPIKPVVCTDATVDLEVLIRVTPPQPDVHFPRPTLNMALVLDRSGSMAGEKKMKYARDAASFVVGQLLPNDRVSVTVFDDIVETIVPNTLATEKTKIVGKIAGIQPRNSTDLHGGWLEGAKQVETNLVEKGVNRVLLLSDGLANVGVVDPKTIAAEAKGKAVKGVSTTTLGVGKDYNEDLMEAVAKQGGGRYFFIDNPAQLVDIFQSELQGLIATLGQQVSLTIETVGGVVLSEMLNEFTKDGAARWNLPNLMVGMPVDAAIRLKVPVPTDLSPLLKVVLNWTDTATKTPQQMQATLNALPAVPLSEWAKLPLDMEVQEQLVLLRMARAQREVGDALDRNDMSTARMKIDDAMNLVGFIPGSASVMAEGNVLRDILQKMDAGDIQYSGKLAKQRAWRGTTGYRHDDQDLKPSGGPESGPGAPPKA